MISRCVTWVWSLDSKSFYPLLTHNPLLIRFGFYSPKAAFSYCFVKLQTALHIAVIIGKPIFTRKLILAGTSLCMPEKAGNTALHLACKEATLGCAEVLLSPVGPELGNTNEIQKLLDCTNYDSKEISHGTAWNLGWGMRIGSVSWWAEGSVWGQQWLALGGMWGRYEHVKSY